jgi:ammonium transporter Rh
VLGRPRSEPEFGNTHDVFALIGTLFLWIYWPSFVAGAAPADSQEQQRGLCNTILCLSGSTVAAFWVSSFLSKNGRYRPVDIQNATLAGGVAVGCVGCLQFSPFSAVCLGITSGAVSAFGFNRIQAFLERNIGLHDSCGIHNLHAMPSVIGALTSVIIAGYHNTDGREVDTQIYGGTRRDAWWRQWVAILWCIGFAVSTGIITGYILKMAEAEQPEPVKQFHDEPFWEVADDYGTSFYNELANVMKAATAKAGMGDLVNAALLDKEVSDWSSHSGRRQRMAPPTTGTAASLDTASLHGPRKTGGAPTTATAVPASTAPGYAAVATSEIELSKV